MEARRGNWSGGPARTAELDGDCRRHTGPTPVEDRDRVVSEAALDTERPSSPGRLSATRGSAWAETPLLPI
jgi:hypothetical protein